MTSPDTAVRRHLMVVLAGGLLAGARDTAGRREHGPSGFAPIGELSIGLLKKHDELRK